MMTLLPFPENRDMVWDYLPELNRPLFHFYYFLLFFSAAGMVALFQYRVPVSIPVSGTVRPAFERTEIHPVVGGVIEKIFVSEGDSVRKNDLLFLLQDPSGPPEAGMNETELVRQENLVRDLQQLTATNTLNHGLLKRLQTPLYRDQAAAYLSKESGENLNWTGARHEAEMGRLLVKDKVISPKEFYDQQLKEDKMRTSMKVLHRAQWAAWQAELVEHQQALAACLNRRAEFVARAAQMEIRAPLGGIVAGIRGWYPGSSIRPEQSLGTVSPVGDLIGECFVSSRSAALLQAGQLLRIRIDALNNGQSGFLPGKIISVSDDISLVGNQPVFTVRCEFGRDARISKGRCRGLLKKGLSFQARCIVTERTLFQLLYDRMEDWLNPVSSPSYSA